MEESVFGGSATASAFGARVDIKMPGQGMYLVIGRCNSPSELVRRVGGRIVLKVSARKLLVILPVTAYLGFPSHPDIAFIGPIGLDQDRFAQFCALFGQGPSLGGGKEVRDHE